MLLVAESRLASLTCGMSPPSCRNVATSLPLELHDNEGLYKKMKRFNIE
jgi:hypothetical protein